MPMGLGAGSSTNIGGAGLGLFANMSLNDSKAPLGQPNTDS
jgi:hypothetical protein